MTLNVLGGMDKQPEHCGWKLRSSDGSIDCQRLFVDGTKFSERLVHLLPEPVNKDSHTPVRSRNSFRFECLQLSRVQRLAPRIGKQAVEHA